ncbi:MAG TPA: nucleotide exchange factor GrpE [Solirubrobacteraceae bacterium]|nr:nucleotide exchange factor GrpE [Solirubrobacteraceae bacterium]
MRNTEGTVTGAGTPRAADAEGPGEGQERDLFPDQNASGEGPAPAPAPAAGGAAADAADVEEAVELAGDLDELVRTAAQRDEYLALAQRTQADFENYRKRVAREATAAQERGCATLAKELLPALDNLDRALEAAAADDPLLEGVKLVRAELNAALGRAGIESFSPLGEAFDPSLHEAMATLPQPPEGQPSGTVVEVYQPGYRLGKNIIRPARVVVAA